ncbi:hypothetical protein [Nodularia sp. UHCC 0506]|uniref:hypothetical protein n=1 Tax=Nodularia sp. UHCC 0506 TaxID=3110243 RepID=UPI002B2213AD|nr:hypothetical protein [Nodularia sp. UHCC 0506]MEA5515550.1 hypothetical protein [Nodularia sp. UHCC 0506]
MARRRPKPEVASKTIWECIQQGCQNCHQEMWHEYDNYRHVKTLKGVVQLRLKIRRCQNPVCESFRLN